MEYLKIQDEYLQERLSQLQITNVKNIKTIKEIYPESNLENAYKICLWQQAGFDKNKIFATQGSYSKIQCAEACHNTLYDDTELVNKMIKQTNSDLKIPT